MSKQHFEEIKQRYPVAAKALGITEDMDFDEWREAYNREALRRLMQPLPVDTSGLKTPMPYWQRWYSTKGE